MVFTEKNKQALLIGLIMAAFLGFLVGYYYWLSKPVIAKTQKERGTLNAQIKKDQAEINRMRALIENTAEREQMAEVVRRAKERLPEDRRAIEFLTLLRDSLTKTGVVQTRVAPEAPKRRALYEEIPYSVKGSARYHEFGQFLNLIECNPDRFMRVNGFSLSNDPNRPSIHPMEVGISTFMFRSR
ncbi:type 4a pilus biogenesis protein PilO [bacterium]|nr:type 4a pilus biogenesis protein PilO [bacterium]